MSYQIANMAKINIFMRHDIEAGVFSHQEDSPDMMAQQEKRKNGTVDIAAQGENVDDQSRAKQKDATNEGIEKNITYARDLERTNRNSESMDKKMTHPTPEELLALMGVENKTTQGVNSDARLSNDIDGAPKEAIRA